MPNDLYTPFATTSTGTKLDCRPKPICDPRPVCPACGGLECLCRPRFFAGQLLTDEDLNRLDHYIVAKNRLHNRHLFGWGVACGLEVVCSVCDPAGGSSVVVKPGYALSPCGNDIIVCREESVPVCDLINQCRPRLPDACLDPGAGSPVDCARGTEQWVLAICYNEKPSRGVTALRGASGASCGCGNVGCSCCAGKISAKSGTQSGCGCSAAANGSRGTATQSSSPKQLPAQCEPTLTCEGYTFAVYKAPTAKGRQVEYGALVQRFLCCVQGLFEQLSGLPTDATQEARQQWLADFKNAVQDFLVTEGLYDCDLAQQLGAVSVPVAGQVDATYVSQWQTATFNVVAVVVAVLRKCLCGALLPPCPDPEMADCVPIATITVERGQCRVRQVCNLSNRRFLVTFPALEYWLSWLPAFQQWTGAKAGTTLAAVIERMCCPPVKDTMESLRNSVNLMEPKVALKAETIARPQKETAAPEHPFAEILGEAFTPRAVPVNAGTLLLAAMGATDAKGGALMTPLELQHPAETLLTHQVLAPMLATMLPGMGLQAGASASDITSLKRTVEELRKTVNEQQSTIDRLSKR